VVLLAAWLARAAFIVFMPEEAHSADVDSWVKVAHQLRIGENPYVTEATLNWPPLWMILIFAIDRAAEFAGLSFFLALRIFLVGVESLLIVVLYLCIFSVNPSQARRVVLIGISLNPIAILLVCQHGNFDVLVGLGVLCGALALGTYDRLKDPLFWLAASAAFGIAALAKTVPLVLAPLLSRGARISTPVARLLAAMLFVGPILLGLATLFVLAPHDITDKVLTYRSASGWFGVTGILSAVGADQLSRIYESPVFYLLLLAWFVWGTRWLARDGIGRNRAILLAGLVMLAVPTLGPGYAPQYAYWWMPLLVATYCLFDAVWRRALLIFYGLAVLTYVAEYGLFFSHGAFLHVLFPDNRLIDMAWQDSVRREWQTVIRLPLFLGSLAILAIGARRLRPNRPEI
jgi:hypothetical protein